MDKPDVGTAAPTAKRAVAPGALTIGSVVTAMISFVVPGERILTDRASGVPILIVGWLPGASAWRGSSPVRMVSTRC